MTEFVNFWPFVMPIAFYLFFYPRDRFSLTSEKFDLEYDYIVVGAGSAGAVVASRLSEDPRVTVLLLEAGGKENIVTDIPIAAAMIQKTPLDWAYQTEPQDAACFGHINRRSRWPRGKVLGGSSVLNYMLYIRGNPRDYDSWERDYGAYGWNWREVFPYFLKSEDNRDPSIANNGYHGKGGYLTVSTPPYATPLAHAFVAGGSSLGYPNIDLNGPIQTGFAIPQGTIRRGSRCSTSKAFLKPTKGRSNIDIVIFAFATKILFDENLIARAIQFDRLGLSHTVYARKEIILSAGTINTPQLLMLSGIGPKDNLLNLGIPVLADLPVGLNLQDHIYPGVLAYLVDYPVSAVQSRIFTAENIFRYFAFSDGPLTLLGGVEGLGFIKTKYANSSDDFPDVEVHFLSGSYGADAGHVFRGSQGINDELWQKVYLEFLEKDSFSLFPVLLRPRSRGFIKLRSSNPYDPPIIDPRYLTDERDVFTMVDSLKICLALGDTPGFRKYGARINPNVFPGCEGYVQWSDEYLACLARTITSTIYHPVGTCKMGNPHDPTTVVDPQLRVKHVKGLRVVDGSVMPTIVSGNTNAPIIMIAEKASDMIRGINSVFAQRSQNKI
ncbi:glucose dehydrogenase [FAD, quinone]-like [Tachypleus tridentatus]|uniref:glucose dehydrogenase [FAD, quinone]-like n=1 Tax=Tachypleus tridentatus TaxID=6853 RepID=UPI003FD50E13